MGFLFPKAAIRNFLMDVYFGRVHISSEDLVKMLRHDMGFDLRHFSDEDIQKGIEGFRGDVEVIDLMKIPLPHN
jgi:hypothetical protein